jgi:hypothetical protein
MAWNRRLTGKAAIFLAVCMWGAAVYSFGYGMELSSATQKMIFFWVRFEHLGIQLIAPTWLLFAMSVSGCWCFWLSFRFISLGHRRLWDGSTGPTEIPGLI